MFTIEEKETEDMLNFSKLLLLTAAFVTLSAKGMEEDPGSPSETPQDTQQATLQQLNDHSLDPEGQLALFQRLPRVSRDLPNKRP